MRTSWLIPLLAVLGAGPAHAGNPGAPAAPPAADATVSGQPPARSPSGIAVGAEVGEPSSLIARWAGAGGRLGIDAGIGSGMRGGRGLSLHAGFTVAPVALRLGGSSVLTPYLGAGVRHYRHHYEPRSIDELDDNHTGVRLLAGLALALGRLEIYAQGGPGWDLSRTASCSLISGVDSVCPHAQSSAIFVHAVLGVRYYIR